MNKKWIIPFYALLISLSTSVGANERSPIVQVVGLDLEPEEFQFEKMNQDEQTHAIVGLREFEGEVLEEDEIIACEDEEEVEIVENGCYGYDVHPAVNFFMTWVGPGGATLDFHDESKFGIHASDRHRVTRWFAEDPIHLSYRGRGDYAFYLTNCNSGEYVRARLLNGPRIRGQYTRNFSFIDFENHLVYLTDGSAFHWAATDTHKVKVWFESMRAFNENHAVLVGYNTGLSSLFNGYLLFNVEMNDHIRAEWVR